MQNSKINCFFEIYPYESFKQSKLFEKWYAFVCKNQDHDLTHTSDYAECESLRIEPSGRYYIFCGICNGEISSLISFSTGQAILSFNIGDRSIINLHLRSIRVINKVLLLQEPLVFEEFLKQCDCNNIPFDIVDLKSIETKTCFHKYLEKNRRIGNKYNIYSPFDITHRYSTLIDCSWDEYLRRLNKKARHEIRRKIRRFEEKNQDNFLFLKYYSKDHVNQFLPNVRRISDNSWQKMRVGTREIDDRSYSTRNYLISLAESGRFRGYVLFVEGVPVAYAFGHIYRQNYHLKEIAYDQNNFEDAPGIILLSKLIQDLCENDKPILLDFGPGDSRYKSEFCNILKEEKRIWIVKKSFSNITIFFLYNFYRAIYKQTSNLIKQTKLSYGVKRWLKRGSGK